MDSDYWHKRWATGQIGGFHEGAPNVHLVTHLARLGPARRVLVPLCGKSEDLTFLAAQGHQVIGVELVESAVQAFFEAHQVTPEVSKAGPFTCYRAQQVTIFAGDFFAATGERLGGVDALYDRAAIIALPEPMRADYARHVRALMPAGSPGLVITFEYPQALLAGPPFSVPEAELRGHYAGLAVERLFEVKAEAPRVSLIDAKEKGFVVTF
jgi:thiopurine S-methyltransferase